MTFPIIQFKGTNVNVDAAWTGLIDQKFQTLSKYVGTRTDNTCHVEFEKLGTQHTGNIHRVEATVFARGKVFRAEAIESTFENAIDTLHKELERELAKSNEKRDTLIKRGRQAIKEMMRWGK